MNRNFTGGLWAAAAGLALTAASLAGPASAAQATHPSHARATSLAATYEGRLYGVAATSARNAWAVGITFTQAQILHWNGTAWTRQYLSPGPVLYGVAATSASDAWTVGQTGWWHGQPYIMHWNGTAWTRVPSPTFKRDSMLYAVTALSPSNAWAVGVVGASAGYGVLRCAKTLIEHWNGHAWRRVHSPTPDVSGALRGVTAISARDVWAAGWAGTGPDIHGTRAVTLIEHWNGRAWKVVRSPSPGGIRTALQAIDAVSRTNIWAVGVTNWLGADKGYILHYDGTSWRRVPHPDPAPGANFVAVSAASAGNVWLTGYTLYQANCAPTCQTVTEHWNGRAWTLVPSPNQPGAWINVPMGVAAVSRSNAWAVGTTDWQATLILHWNGRAWKTWG